MKHFYNLRPFFSILKKSAQLAQRLAMLAIIAWPSAKLFAQAPAISYSTPQTYTAYTPMTPLSPSNAGGAVTALSFNASTTTLNTGISDASCVAAGSDGKLYIGESSGKVSVYTPGGGPATVLGLGFGPVAGICVDKSNNVFLADGTNVWKIPAGGGAATNAGNGDYLIHPTGVAVDAGENIWVTDPNVGLLVILASGYAEEDISTVSAPNGIALDASGNAFIGSQSGPGLYEVSGGSDATTQISNAFTPQAITVDASNNVYVATSSGVYVRPAGGGGLFLVGSGTSFNATGLAVDANLNLYLANGTITETQPNGGYFIKPALLQGLTFDMNGGQISGTPGAISANNNYTITAFNASGNSSAPLAITINAPAAPKIIYFNAHDFNQDVTIGLESPTTLSGGGVVPAPAFNPSVTTVWSSGDFAPGLAMDKAGNFYIGDYTAKEVLKLAPGSSSPAVFATGFSSVAGVAVDASGNVYLADPTGDKLWKIPAAGGTALALGNFNYPFGVATDAAGNVYVADRQSGVYKMAPDGTGQTSLSSTVSACVTVDMNGNVFFGDFNGNVDEIPVGGAQKVFGNLGGPYWSITTDASGNVYVVRLNTIYMLPAGGGSPIHVGPSIIGKEPAGLWVDGSYNLYWMWDGLHKANATGGYFISPEPPQGITMDPNSGIITGTPVNSSPVVDHTVTAFNTTGRGTAFLAMIVIPLPPAVTYNTPQTYNVGTAITPLTPANTGGAVAAPAYSNPGNFCLRRGEYDSGLAMDKAGNIYIADVSGRVVLELAPGSNTATVFNQDYGTVNGIAVDASGNVYVADAGGSALWEIPAGGAAAKFKLGSYTTPRGVSLDAAGNIYVADYTSGIFKMAADGTGQTNISSTSSTFVSVDLNGNVFFADSSGNIYEIPVGGTQKVIYSAPNSLLALETDASGNVYYTCYQANGIYMLPAGGGTPVQVSSLVTNSGTHTMGLMFDAAQNLYFTFDGVNRAKVLGGYYASPELPAGITIDPTSGVISGTPLVTAAAANYTITAVSATATGTTAVNIAVNQQLPAISYSTPQNYTTGTAITALTPASAGGAVSAAAFNTTATTLATGFSGSPPIAMDKAGNIYIGNASGTGTIDVLAPGSSTPTVFATGLGVPEGLAIDASGNVYFTDGTNLVLTKIPAGGGTPVNLGSFTQPHGLAIDASGNIYVADATSGVYKMAPNGSGQTNISSTAAKYVCVDLNGNVFFSDLSSSGNVYEIPVGGVQKLFYSAGIYIQSLTPDQSGNVYAMVTKSTVGYIEMVPAAGGTAIEMGPFGFGHNAVSLMVDPGYNLYWMNGGNLYKANATGGYFISPELPNGLTIDPTSGVISGTPVAASAPTNYTITAFNTGGSGTAALNIGVNVALPAISYITPPTYTTGTAITPLTPASIGGPVAAPQFNTTVTTLATGLSGFPTAAAMDNAGNIYLSVQGEYNTPASSINVLAPGSSTPTAFASGFYGVHQMATDASGNVYVADPQSGLWKIPAGGGTKVALGSFTAPNGVAVDAAGNIYVGDGFTGVYKMAADGTWRTNLSTTRAGFVLVDLNGNVFFNNLEQLYEIPAGGTQKLIYTTPIRKGAFWSLTTDTSGNIYFWVGGASGANFITMLPAGGGSTVQVLRSIPLTTGLMVDAGFNMYWINSGSLYKANAAGGYFVSPELPAGLTLDPTSGAISGSPALTSASAAANYTVTAFNAAGSAMATVNIAINASLPVISYSTPQTYFINTAITPLTPANTGGAVAGAGLSAPVTVTTGVSDANCVTFDQVGNMYIGENGQVSELYSGTTTAVPIATGFKQISSIAVDVSDNVYVTDGSVWKIPSGGGPTLGLDTWGLAQGIAVDVANNIYVADVVNGVFKIAADGSKKTRIDNTPAAFIAADMNGNLIFSASTGSAIYEILKGGTRQLIPVDGAAALTADLSGNFYVLDYFGALNIIYPGGSAPVNLPLVFGGGTITGLATDAHFNLYGMGGNISELSPTGGYFTNPELPRGLNVSPTTGSISGTPTTPFAATNFTVTAFNTAGSGIATVNISLANANDNLSGLVLSAGVKSPGFTSAHTSYTASVGNVVSSITVTPTAVDPNATILVNGSDGVVSGAASAPIALVEGPNTITVKVTATNGNATQTYTVTVTRAAASNASLSALVLNPGIKNPAFSSADTSYTASVVNAVSSTIITPTTGDPNATVKVDGITVASGTASGPVPLNVGANTITITVTAQDGSTTKTYTVTVTRAGSTNANLSSLKLNPGLLTPVFISPVTSYTANVVNGVSSTIETPTAADPNATIKVNGITVASGASSGPITLNIGPNIITTVVTAQDGTTTKIYTATITRAGSTDALLTSLKLSAGTKSPVFGGSTFRYTDSVSHGVSTITVTPTAKDPDATIMVNNVTVASGATSDSISMHAGDNIIAIVITATDGVTQKTYVVTVTRASPESFNTVYEPVGVSKPTETPTLNEDGIVVHQGVSPNGDGINDFLQIDNISQYPDNKLMIMNRNGQLIYQASGYDNSSKVFDGHNNKNGQMQLPGTYFYQLDYMANGIAKHKTGFIILKY